MEFTLLQELFFKLTTKGAESTLFLLDITNPSNCEARLFVLVLYQIQGNRNCIVVLIIVLTKYD